MKSHRIAARSGNSRVSKQQVKELKMNKKSVAVDARVSEFKQRFQSVPETPEFAICVPGFSYEKLYRINQNLYTTIDNCVQIMIDRGIDSPFKLKVEHIEEFNRMFIEALPELPLRELDLVFMNKMVLSQYFERIKTGKNTFQTAMNSGSKNVIAAS